jgi:peroxiredoxin
MSYDEERRTIPEYIDVLSVSLTSMAIADDSGEHTAGFQVDWVETNLMIPVWSIRFKTTYEGGSEEEYCTYPFSATDGGALSQMDG